MTGVLSYPGRAAHVDAAKKSSTDPTRFQASERMRGSIVNQFFSAWRGVQNDLDEHIYQVDAHADFSSDSAGSSTDRIPGVISI
ncbi:MAG: hypothetical protein WBN83_15115 [Desulfoprunum sp.]|jgi:hypothetical protein|uniref:hypothetical protein n=1 Tax=Desulfoprunum sp. TaxID=2020866 RepID=UPI003C719978